jgi:thiol-disulfide isomerase/thioredoxin
MTDPVEQDPTLPRSSTRLIAAGALALVILGVSGVLYGIVGMPGKETSAACPAAVAAGQRVDPLAHGEVAAFAIAKDPKPMPALSFDGPDGARKTLADFKGRTILLNLWATWCVPCRQEMPALDHLQSDLGGPNFQVVAVNIDTTRLDRPKKFLADTGVKTLGFYADSTADVFEALKTAGKVAGLPTSILIDGQGCEIGTLAGPAEWNSTDAASLVRAAVGT